MSKPRTLKIRSYAESLPKMNYYLIILPKSKNYKHIGEANIKTLYYTVFPMAGPNKPT